MVEMVEILDGRLGKRSVERVRYVINNLLQLVIVKYVVISLILCISTRLRLVTEHPSVGLASLAQLDNVLQLLAILLGSYYTFQSNYYNK